MIFASREAKRGLSCSNRECLYLLLHCLHPSSSATHIHTSIATRLEMSAGRFSADTSSPIAVSGVGEREWFFVVLCHPGKLSFTNMTLTSSAEHSAHNTPLIYTSLDSIACTGTTTWTNTKGVSGSGGVLECSSLYHSQVTLSPKFPPSFAQTDSTHTGDVTPSTSLITTLTHVDGRRSVERGWRRWRWKWKCRGWRMKGRWL